MPSDTIVQFDFSEALRHLRAGKRVRRLEWDARFRWIELDAHIFIAGPRGDHGHQWIGCERDILATDWVLVEEGKT